MPVETVLKYGRMITGPEALPLVPDAYRFAALPGEIPPGKCGIGETKSLHLGGSTPQLARGLRASTHVEGWWAVVTVPAWAGESGLTSVCNRAIKIARERLAKSKTGNKP